MARRWRALVQPRPRGRRRVDGASRSRHREVDAIAAKGKEKRGRRKSTGFHARLPTRAVCPRIDRTSAMRDASQSWTAAESVPTHRCDPPGAQLTDVTQSPCSNCNNSETSLVAAFHK